MRPETVPICRKEYVQEDGMLFVRTVGILETMAKIPLLFAGLLMVAIAMPFQTSLGSSRTLDLVIYSDGTAHVSSKMDVDPLDPDFVVDLFGPSIDNFVAIGDGGFLLSSEIVDDKATIDTFGSSSITIDYDIHDLVSKEGRVWTFSLDSPSDYTLLMPENSVIVGMSALPINMELINEQTKLNFSSGPAEINYIFGAIPPANHSTPAEPSFDYMTTAVIASPIAAAAVGISLLLRKKQSKSTMQVQDTEPNIQKEQKTRAVDLDAILKVRPEMRDDDKEIVKFISESGGQVFESDLRKKFLQPRTTMWRAVKRLERLGLVEITKKDLQNVVTLKEELEEEE